MRFVKFVTIGASLVWLVGVFLFWSSMGPVVQAQNPDWSKPVEVSPKSEPGVYHWFPEIVADLEGNIHLFWVSKRDSKNNLYGGYDTVLHCVVRNEECSNPAEIIAFDWHAGINATRPVAKVDERNIIHLLTRGAPGVMAFSQIFYQQAPANQASLARAWSEPIRISNARGATYYSDIVINKRGDIHVIWNEIVSPSDPQLVEACFVCSDIFYRRSSNNGQTWSTPVDLTNSTTEERKPQLLLDDQENLSVFWEEVNYVSAGGSWVPASSGMASSANGGDTWLLPARFVFPNSVPQQVTAGVDSQKKLVVVWGLLDGQGIYYQSSSDRGRSWSLPHPIPGVLPRTRTNNWDTYHMRPDSAGHLHLVLVGRAANYDPTTSSVFHLEWDGKAWSEPKAIFTVNGDLPEWPRIVVVNGNQLHVTWFVRDKDHLNDPGGTSQYKIWYAYGQSQAPSMTPVIQPMATPTLAPTATPTMTPVSTPTVDPSLAQLSAVPAGTIDTIYTETDDLILLALSVAPAALIIVLVVVSVRIWRR